MNQRSILFLRADTNVAAGNICGSETFADKIEAMLRTLPGEAFELVRVGSLLDGLRVLEDRPFDLIFTDLFLPDAQGIAAVRNLHQHRPETPVIVLCDSCDRDTAVTAVREGAFDFFCYEELDVKTLGNSVQGALKHASSEAGKNAETERRNNARFPCRLAISYQTLEHPVLSGQGSSETLNISSKGILFASDEKFQPGQMLQVSLDWPVRLENQVPLKLVAEGRIVRNSGGQTAMTIEKYEFRTRRTPAPRVPEAAGTSAVSGKATRP